MRSCRLFSCSFLIYIGFFSLLCALILGVPAENWIAGPRRNEPTISTHAVDDKHTLSFIINLDRSPQRYEKIAPLVYDLGWPVRRVAATEGASLSEEQLHNVLDKEAYRILMKRPPQLGTIGCSLSHIQTWQRFLDSDAAYALIFEDDVSFDPEALSHAIEDLQERPDTWDLVLFEVFHHGTPLPLMTLLHGSTLSVYLTEISHTGAYLINRRAAQRLLAQALPIRMPIDHYLAQSWHFDLVLMGLENPRLVFQTYGDSHIAQSPRLASSTPRLSFYEYMLHAFYKGQSYLIRFFYGLKSFALWHKQHSFATNKTQTLSEQDTTEADPASV